MELERLGYTILSVTCDGFRSNINTFRKHPLQICLFHLKRMVERGTTKNPQSEAEKAILHLSEEIHISTHQTFSYKLKQYYRTHKDFLLEKTRHPNGTSSYTHRGVRSAYFALVHWLEYIFTFQTNENTPKTTNSCEGHFSHLKDVLRIHRGLSRRNKERFISTIFLAGTIAPKHYKREK